MRRPRTSFKRVDFRRAVRSALESGLPISRVEVDAAGKIAVIVGAPEQPAPSGDRDNPWDQIYANEKRPS